jgi:hypothetical protein
MLPAWATVLIAIAASAVGGVVGALLQTRHERSEAIRERMLIAAADFSGKLGQALKWAVALSRRADVALNDRATELTGVEEALREARQRLDATDEPLSRIDLLFGITSPTRMSAVEAVVGIQDFLKDFEDWPPRSEHVEALTEADVEYVRFNQNARRAIETNGALTPPIRFRRE